SHPGNELGYTIAEKILGAHSGGKPAAAGDIVGAAVDFAMGYDGRAGNALKRAGRFRTGGLPFPAESAFVREHYSPRPHTEAANTHRDMRAFAGEQGAVLYDVGDGICHQVMPEGGHVTCGDLIVGTDTHTVTYGAFNAFSTGVEGTDVAAVMKTGKLWLRRPPTPRNGGNGRAPPGGGGEGHDPARLRRFA